MSKRRGIPTLTSLAVLAAMVAGCGEKKVEKAELERQVKSALAAKVGQEPKAIRCPGDIDSKVGATTRCVLVAPDDSELDVDVRVTSVEGDKARFDIQAGTQVRRP